MTKRLDVTAAINLIGEDNLREEFDRNTWSYLHLRNEDKDNGYFNVTETKVNKLKRFKTEANPVEYLIFNKTAFSREISVNVVASVYKQLKFKNEDDFVEFVLNEEWEITPEISNTVWNAIGKELSHNEIKDFFNIMNNGSDEMFFLFDKDGNQVLPEPTDKFLNKWFPR